MWLYFTRDGLTTIHDIGQKYCAEGCEHWEPNVTRFYHDELGGDTTDLGFSETPPPPGPQPGQNIGDIAMIPMLSGGMAAIAVESDVRTVFIAEGSGELSRLDLATGEVTTVAFVSADRIIQVALESGGAAAIVLTQNPNPPFPAGISRVSLTTGEV